VSDNSGPAFPESYEGLDMPHAGIGGGLTKREIFAMAAMQGMLSSWPANSKFVPVTTAQHAIEFADALIEELNKEVSDE